MTAANNVTFHTINENLARIQAGFIALAGIAFALTGHWFALLLLAYDFSARLFITPKVAPFYLLAQAIAKVSKIANRPTDAEAKLFAARIWLAASLLALYFALEGSHLAAIAITTLLALCSAAEALLNFCIGCKLYALLKHFNIEITSLKD